MDVLQNGDQRRAAAAEAIKRASDALTDPAIIEDWVEQYRQRMPIKDIVARALEKDPELFQDLSVALHAGVVRAKIRALVSNEERRKIEFHHRSTGQAATYARGRTSVLTPDIAQLGGEKSGRQHFERGTGMFGLSEEKRRESARAGGAASHAAMGHIPWFPANQENEDMSELDFCFHLASLDTFQHKKGKNRGTVDNQAIADELNRVFHANKPIRTASQVRVRRGTEKKRRLLRAIEEDLLE